MEKILNFYAPGSQDLSEVRLDETDEKILWELTRDARIPNNQLAEKLHIAPSTALARVRELRRKGVILGAYTFVDMRAVGLPLQAMISVRLRGQARAELKTYALRVMRFPSVLAAFSLGGTEDFLVLVACTDPQHLRDFVSVYFSADPAVASTQTNLVFESFNGSQFMDQIEGWQDMRAAVDGAR